MTISKFSVQEVAPSKSRRATKSTKDLLAAWKTVANNGQVEACSSLPDNAVLLFDKNNMLARAVHAAFYEHHPLRLSPDVIWLTIVQGFANHVNQNAEELRSLFVSFEGKEEIVVSRPEFVKGSPNNDWMGVFPEFSAKIEGYIGSKTRQMLECTFSTTTILEKTVSHIVLMDSVKAYFKYVAVCGCGIPYIELSGTSEDWQSIRNRVVEFEKFDLAWWVQELLPILDQFVLASKGYHLSRGGERVRGKNVGMPTLFVGRGRKMMLFVLVQN